MIEMAFFGPDARFNHVGMAVKSIAAVSPDSPIIFDPIQNVSVAFVMMHGIRMELIEPSGDRSPVLESLKKGIKLLHICYEVDDLEAAVRTCRKHGFHAISRPAPAVAFGGRRIAWVYNNQFGLFELLEDVSVSVERDAAPGA